MKTNNKFITIVAIVIMLFYSLFNNNIVYAAEHVTGDNVVYREVAVNVTLAFNWFPSAGAYKYYVDDATGIPGGDAYYFWKYGDNNKFAACTKSNLFAYVLNNGTGLTVSNERLQALITAYYGQFANVETGFLFDGQGNKLGIALNDISGCVYENAPNNTNMTIPSQEINNVYNFYQYYINTVNPEAPDYITVKTSKNVDMLTKIDTTSGRKIGNESALGVAGSGLNLHFNNSSNEFKYDSGGSNYGFNHYDDTNASFYSIGTTTWSNFCRDYSLIQNGDSVTYEDILTNTSYSSLQIYMYDNTNSQRITDYTRYTVTGSTYTSTAQNIGQNPISLVYRRLVPCTQDGHDITVYKDNTVFTQIVNNTYAPQTFSSNTYNNFDTNSTQNISTNSSVVNNASTTNSSVYNDASQSFTNYYSEESNYNIDNSVVIENTTNIINNYYGNGEDPDPDPNPDPNPDPDDDDPIWTALLKAIADFFKKLGELIATVLTGIVTILTSILEAIATIVNDFTGITDFLGQIFAWLPSEIVTLMTLGLTTALFAAFLTWFKK